jgi:cation diffusion facilitator family transporter
VTQQHHRYHQARNITLIGAGVNTLLGIMKVVAGTFFYSHALIADGLHSFADLFTDMMVVFASKYGNQDADEAHPYGHQRIETAATLMLSLLLILTGIAIAWDSLQHILAHAIQTPSYFALPFAVISVVANEILFYITKRVGHRIQSPLIIANAWHHRSDSASSGVVVLGIIGSLVGYTYLDPAAAILVGGLIIKMGFNYGWDSVKELVDTGVDLAQIEEIRQVIGQVDGVCKVHQLRNRKMGGDIFVDVHVLVSPWISVSEGHQIAQRVHFELMEANSQIKDVTVHIDPEDDELILPSLNLPSRPALEKKLFHKWTQQFPNIQSIVLHYLDGQIKVEIKLDKKFKKWSELELMVREDFSLYPAITAVELLYHHTLMQRVEQKG